MQLPIALTIIIPYVYIKLSQSILQLKLINFVSKLLECYLCAFNIKRLIFLRAKYLWEVVRNEPAQDQVGVSDCQEAAFFAVADGTWISACRFWSHFVQTIKKEESRTTSSSYCVDVQLWCLYRNTCDGSLKDMLMVFMESRHISGGTTHVEPDDWHMCRLWSVQELRLEVCGGMGVANDASSWAR